MCGEFHQSHLNCLDKRPVFMTVSKPLLTESFIMDLRVVSISIINLNVNEMKSRNVNVMKLKKKCQFSITFKVNVLTKRIPLLISHEYRLINSYF